ncbi:MAG: hypothetical protein JXR94_01520, partial [Candidatus Hydrogenedentes bacterium]|nr:hypothetical protein [Candidatus Hydrogenedentota bacterium]
MIGLVLTPPTCMFLVLTEVMWRSGYPSILSLMYHVVFVLFWLVLGNLALARLKPAWALSASELLVVYTMLSVASALCGHDMLQVLVPTLSHLHWCHDIEGRYYELLPHVPAWLVVEDHTALVSAYGGQESMYAWANLGPWLGPLGWWFCFVMALCAVMWGLCLLFRKQWTEHEKLSYPVIRVPLTLAREPLSLLRNRVFWLAFGMAFAVDLLNGLHVLFPTFPHIPLVQIVDLRNLFAERPWRDMGGAPVSFYFFAIGMCFFMPLDLAFSCWFFWICLKLQRVLASHMGMHGMPGFPFIEEQAAGAYYAIALTSLWFARHHLIRLARILLGRPGGAGGRAEPGEILECRVAALLLSGGGAFLVYFCVRAGMDFGVVALFFALYFLMAIGITRIRAELGPPTVDTYGMGAHLQSTKLLGAGRMAGANPVNLVMFGFLSAIARTSRTHPMPHGLEGFRIAERLQLSTMKYFAAMWVAIVAGTASAFWAMLFVYNKYGISAEVMGIPYWLGEETWNRVNVWMTAPERWSLAPTYAVLVGMLVAFGLAMLRGNLPWWPFLPAGYAISGGPGASMDVLWASVFVAWLVKVLLLKYGGAR